MEQKVWSYLSPRFIGGAPGDWLLALGVGRNQKVQALTAPSFLYPENIRQVPPRPAM